MKIKKSLTHIYIIMNTENKILGNQLVVMSKSDLDTMVNEMAQNIVAAQSKKMQNDS